MSELFFLMFLLVVFSLLAWFASRQKDIPRVKKQRSQPVKPPLKANEKPHSTKEEELFTEAHMRFHLERIDENVRKIEGHFRRFLLVIAMASSIGGLLFILKWKPILDAWIKFR